MITQRGRKRQKEMVKARAEIKAAWVKMCEHDGIDPTFTMFAVFSDDNPYQDPYQEALERYWQTRR